MSRWKEIEEALIHGTPLDYEDTTWIVNKINEQEEEIIRLKEYIKYTNEQLQRIHDGSKGLLEYEE